MSRINKELEKENLVRQNILFYRENNRLKKFKNFSIKN